MTKYSTTQYNKFKRIESVIYDVYRQAKTWQHSLEELMEAQKKYLNHPEKEALPQYYQGKLSGIADVFFGIIQTKELKWLMYYTNRADRVVYVKKWEHLPKYIRNNGNFNGNHFWKNPIKLTDGRGFIHRPFGNNPSKGTRMKG